MKKCHSNIQMIANIATTASIVFLILVYFLDIRKTSKQKDYEYFIFLQNQRNELISKRDNLYIDIQKALNSIDNFHNSEYWNLNSVSFLSLRTDSKTGLTEIESDLLSLEMHCIAYMDKMCSLSKGNPRVKEVLNDTERFEILFYKSNKADIDKLSTYYAKRSNIVINTLNIESFTL